MDVEVLYQKLGDRWFAFSLVDGEVFMAPVADEVIHEIRASKNTPESATDETAYGALSAHDPGGARASSGAVSQGTRGANPQGRREDRQESGESGTDLCSMAQGREIPHQKEGCRLRHTQRVRFALTRHSIAFIYLIKSGVFACERVRRSRKIKKRAQDAPGFWRKRFSMMKWILVLIASSGLTQGLSSNAGPLGDASDGNRIAEPELKDYVRAERTPGFSPVTGVVDANGDPVNDSN
jgi:hypothetical protein